MRNFNFNFKNQNCILSLGPCLHLEQLPNHVHTSLDQVLFFKRTSHLDFNFWKKLRESPFHFKDFLKKSPVQFQTKFSFKTLNSHSPKKFLSRSTSKFYISICIYQNCFFSNYSQSTFNNVSNHTSTACLILTPSHPPITIQNNLHLTHFL
jgi:hypothetical protein